MEKTREKKGMSLITLIISILILLILTGATILGLNGILSKAEDAVNKNNVAITEQNIQLAILELDFALLTKQKSYDEDMIDLEQLPDVFKLNNPIVGWVNIKGNRVNNYGFYYNDFYIIKTNGQVRTVDLRFRESKSQLIINVEDYGAKGDDGIDDTKAIQGAVKYLNENGGTLYFPTGTYNVNVNKHADSVIELKSEKEVKIDFGGSKLVLKENGYTHYNVIFVNSCANAEVRNGFLVGDRLNHDYETATENTTHEFGYGIFFNQTLLGTVVNMDISDMTGDAIVNKNGLSGGIVNITECNLHHCRRQGISILDTDVINITNTKIHHIGTFDNILGTAPKSGIDIEPGSGTNKVNSVLIDNVEIWNADGGGVLASGKSKYNLGDVIIFNSVIDGIWTAGDVGCCYLKKSILNVVNSGGAIFKRSKVRDSKIVLKNEGIDFYIRSCNINNSSIFGEDGGQKSRIILDGGTIVTNSDFQGLQGTVEDKVSADEYCGVLWALEGDKGGKNTFNNCTIMFNTGGIINNSKFKNSPYMYFYNKTSNLRLNEVSIENCLSVEINSDAIIDAYDCTIKNSTFSGKSQHYIHEKYIEQGRIDCFCDF